VINVKPQTPLAPTHDYRAALQKAVSWLGNRYLLAEPLNRRRESGDRPAPNLPNSYSYSR
jgi:hypothetical protein